MKLNRLKLSLWLKLGAKTHQCKPEGINPNIKIIYITSIDIEINQQMLDEWWLGLCGVENTLQIRCVKPVANYIILVSDLSNSEFKRIQLKDIPGAVEHMDTSSLNSEDTTSKLLQF